MAKPSKKTTDQKLRIVLSVLRGEHSVAEAARRDGVAEQSVHNWKRKFLDAGREGLEKGARRRSSRELDDELRRSYVVMAELDRGAIHGHLREWAIKSCASRVPFRFGSRRPLELIMSRI